MFSALGPLSALFAAVLLGRLAIGAQIVPGATWTDTSGNVIQAHGGGILKVGVFLRDK